jgi:hypothetical protein
VGREPALVPEAPAALEGARVASRRLPGPCLGRGQEDIEMRGAGAPGKDAKWAVYWASGGGSGALSATPAGPGDARKPKPAYLLANRLPSIADGACLGAHARKGRNLSKDAIIGGGGGAEPAVFCRVSEARDADAREEAPVRAQTTTGCASQRGHTATGCGP